MGCVLKRKRIIISGIVQGVGFRPFVYRLAMKKELQGFVINSSQGVEIEVEGNISLLDDFISKVTTHPPPQSIITGYKVADIECKNECEFKILPSLKSNNRTVLISPDISICKDCLKELFDSDDRRFGYPFINCTNCGPRYSIIQDVPYDRLKTTMSKFKMCRNCQQEYDDPMNRRFHAQPNCCSACGPRVWLCDSSGCEVETADPIKSAVKLLREGNILGIKGLGGFHLACDAESEKAVLLLRKRKRRSEKPLAVMMKNINVVEKIAVFGDQEKVILQSPERPIVLLMKKKEYYLAESIAPYNKYIGVMLPYTPLHYLLLKDELKAVIMTSGNVSDEPIVIENAEALQKLGSITDYFLFHNRDINIRIDDSVTRFIKKIPRPIRRSRGYVPFPIFNRKVMPSVLGVGGELKNTICLTKGDMAFLSQHIGDLKNRRTFDFFQESIEYLQQILQIKPSVIAHDMHPDYFSTKWAKEKSSIPLVGVQHHHAHIVSCLADNGRDQEVIGLAMDGTGYGDDGSIWGGEILIADTSGYKRVGHLKYRPMPGGDAAIKEPWRMAIGYMYCMFGENGNDLIRKIENIPLVKKIGFKKIEIIIKMIEKQVNTPMTSSLGRLFDGVAALTGIRTEVSYEGQAAIEMEMIIKKGSVLINRNNIYHFHVNKSNEMIYIDPDEVFHEIIFDIEVGLSVNEISLKFHCGIIFCFTEICKILREQRGLNSVALSGGCFLNRFLLENLHALLTKEGFEVLTHSQVPTNDGGISLGQAVVAAQKI